MKKLFRYHLWDILWGLLIIVLTGIPGTMLPKVPAFIDLFQPDKLVHIFIFAVLVALMMRGFILHEGKAVSRDLAVLISINTGILLGALTELMQKYIVPCRSASIYDFIADSVGCFIGWWLFSIWLKRRTGRSEK